MIQNVEHCILHQQPKDPKMQWSPNLVYIKSSTTEKPEQPQPDPTDLNLNPSAVDPAIENLLKELSSQPLESLQQLLLGLQLEFSKRELHPNPTPNPNHNLTPNLPPNNKPKPSNPPSNPNPNNPNGNPPPNNPNGGNPPKLNETVIDPDKLGVTIAKASENLIETLASHGLLRSHTPKISQFSGDDLKGDVSFEHWEYEVDS